MQTKVCTSLEDIERDTWDRLAADLPPFYNHGWFRSHLNSVSKEHVYVLAKDDVSVTAILPGSIVRTSQNCIYHNPRDIILANEFIDNALAYIRATTDSALKKGLLHLLKYTRSIFDRLMFPAAVFVAPDGYVSDIIADHHHERFNEVAMRLLDEVERMADRYGLRCIVFPWVADTNDALSSRLKERGYIRLYGKPVFEIPLGWSSFEEYLNALSRNKRHAIRKERRRFQERGLRVRECGAKEALSRIDEFSSVVHHHLQRFRDGNSFTETRNVLSAMYHHMPEFTRTYYVELEGNVVAYLLSLFKVGVHHPKYVGIADRGENIPYLYFNLAYYDLIESSIRSRDVRRIYYGYAAEEVKLQRGCQSYSGYCYYKFRNKKIHTQARSILDAYSEMRRGYFVHTLARFVRDETKSFLHDMRV